MSWSHYSEILKSDDPLEICFYAKECEAQKWSVRELKRQKSTALFQRFALSMDLRFDVGIDGTQANLEFLTLEDIYNAAAEKISQYKFNTFEEYARNNYRSAVM